MTTGDSDTTPHEPALGEDLTGRDRITRNVLASWGGHAVFIVAGFIMPRLIDEKIGQQALGVWDFAWSLVAYFSLAQAGVVSSVNRYVALYRASGDLDGVNRAVSSVTCILVVMALVVVALGAGAALLMPLLLAQQLAGYLHDAQWVIFLLSVGLAVQVSFSGYAGVLTGCHRWDLHNLIEGAGYAVIVGAMIVLLEMGYGLAAMAAAHAGGQLLGRGVRSALAYRVVPSLRIRVSVATWSQAKEMLTFGGKYFLNTIADLLLTQGVNILILGYLGPAALAIYARPRSLVRHVTTLVNKFAFVLGPSASSLNATQNIEELRTLFVAGTRAAAYITLPLVLTLAILGGPILQVWMGAEYVNGALVAVLALGYMLPIVSEAALAILLGMNLHGRVCVAKLLAGIIALLAVGAMLGTARVTLTTVALIVVISLNLAYSAFLPLYACRSLALSFRCYVKHALAAPLVCALPTSAALLTVRWLGPAAPSALLAFGVIIAAAISAIGYWALRKRTVVTAW